MNSLSFFFVLFLGVNLIHIKADASSRRRLIVTKAVEVNNTEKVNWHAAYEACRSKNMRLLTIKDAEEYEQAATILTELDPDGRNSYWISGTDLGNEGNFYWSSNGKKLTYTKWLRGNPSNSKGNEDCLEYYHSSEYVLNDNDCAALNYFVCEKFYKAEAEELINYGL